MHSAVVALVPVLVLSVRCCSITAHQAVSEIVVVPVVVGGAE